MATLEKKILRRRFLRKYRVLIIIAVCVLCAAVITAAIMLTRTSLSQDNRYSEAYESMQKGDYVAAQSQFAALGDYLDSRDQAQTAEQLIALDDALEREDIDQAKEILDTASLFPLRAQTQSYVQALALYLDGKYQKALDKFLTLEDFKDSVQYVLRCNEYLASQTPDALQRAQEALNNGDYDAALSALEDETGEEAQQLRRQIQYEKAGALRDQGDLTGAYDLYRALEDYRDSAALAEALYKQIPHPLRKMFGGSGDDIVNNMLVTQQGNILVCGGTTSSDGDLQSQNMGDYDGLAMLVNPDGRVLWCQSYGSSGYDMFYYALETKDGGFVFTGVTTSNDPDALTERGAEDVWIVKTDAHGQMLWGATLGGSHSEFGKAVAAPDGGLLIAGQTTSIDGDMVDSYGKREGFAIKISSTGQIAWILMLGGSEDDGFQDCLALSDGYLLLGYTASEDGDLEELEPLGGTDAWAVKISLDGNISWQKRWGGSNADSAMRILPAAQGGYVLVNHTESSDTGAPNRRGKRDIWVQFCDAQLNISYQTLLGSSGDDTLQNAWLMLNNSLGISCMFDVVDGDFATLQSPGNAVITMSADGTVTLDEHFALQGVEITAAVMDASGNMYYGGTSYAPIDDIPYHGGGDIYIECIASGL